MDDGTTVTVAEFGRTVESLFTRAGFHAQQADAIARIITAAERDGAKSHDIYRIEDCLRTLATGKVSPDARPEPIDEGSAVIRVEAGAGFSPAAFKLGLPVLAGRADKPGLAALAVDGCVHSSALWPEVETLAARGLAGPAMAQPQKGPVPWAQGRPAQTAAGFSVMPEIARPAGGPAAWRQASPESRPAIRARPGRGHARGRAPRPG